MLYSYVVQVLMYDCAAWTINCDTTKRTEAMELWFYRRIMRISYSQNMSNEGVLRNALTERKVINKIKQSKLEFLGHVVKKDRIENMFITDFIDSNR